MADILLGYLLTHESFAWEPVFGLIWAASSLLYLAGMVLNDVFDADQDLVERPSRPLPSGRISVARAKSLGFGMLAVGVAFAWVASYWLGDIRPGGTGTLLAMLVLAYDAILKRTPLGPLAMGGCRSLNVLLGMSAAGFEWHAAHLLVAGGIGLYIVGVTWFARTEARVSNRPRLALATIVIVAGIGVLAWLPQWTRGVPLLDHAAPLRWTLFWPLIAMLIGWRCLRAVLEPRPPLVQAAVKNCIFSLIVLDAGVCTFQDMHAALAILALLIPTMFLGRFIYST